VSGNYQRKIVLQAYFRLLPKSFAIHRSRVRVLARLGTILLRH